MRYMYCAECGETVVVNGNDVYVHADSETMDGPDIDRDHAPVPEVEGDFNDRDW